ncbi:Centrosomal protein of 95 kDa [Batrachochytrium dendrobatidis]
MGLIEDISTIDSRDSVSFEKDSAEYPIHRTLLPPSVMAASILAPHMEKYVSHVKRNLQQTIDANNPNRVQKKKPAVVSKLMAGLSRPNPHLHKEGRSTYTSSRAFDVGKDQPTSNISRRERDDFSKKKDKIHRSTVHQQKQSKLASPDRQSSLDSSDLDFDSCGATVETSSTPAFKSANRIAKPGHKHIRFQSQTDQYHTPEILRVTKHDTPHTRALKLRRAILLRQKHTGARNRSPFIMQKKLQDMQRQHQQAMKNGIMASPFKQSPMSKEQSRNHDRNDVDYYEDRAVVDENFSSNLDKSYSKFKGDYVDGADPIKDQDLDGFGKRSRRQLFSDKSKPSRNDQTQFAKLSPPRQNIQAFEDCVRKTIPVVHSKFLTESQRESLWSSQLSTWTRALDDRLWTRKVDMHNKTSQPSSVSLVSLVKKDASRTRLLVIFAYSDFCILYSSAFIYKTRMICLFLMYSVLYGDQEKRKDQAALRHNAKVNLNEKVRRLKRMDQIHNSAQEQVERIADQRYFGEEKMVKGLLDEYIKAQRLAIIEERRLERDTQKKSNEQKKIKEMSRRKLYPFFHLGYCVDMIIYR